MTAETRRRPFSLRRARRFNRIGLFLAGLSLSGGLLGGLTAVTESVAADLKQEKITTEHTKAVRAADTIAENARLNAEDPWRNGQVLVGYQPSLDTPTETDVASSRDLARTAGLVGGIGLFLGIPLAAAGMRRGRRLESLEANTLFITPAERSHAENPRPYGHRQPPTRYFAEAGTYISHSAHPSPR